MDLRKLKTLIDLVAESGITELEVTEGEGKVRIVKGGASGQMMQAPTMISMPAPAPVAMAAPAAAAAVAAEPAAVPAGNVVKSPMVGTFYRAPGPGKPNFVEVGQPIKSGETVCIIEAMKLLNEIECGFDGTILQILVENGQPVEYGQPLLIVS